MNKVKKTLLKLYRFSNSWTGTIVIVALAIFFFAQAFVIPSGSMRSTLLEGDHLIVKKFIYGVPTPHIPWLEVAILPDFRGDGHLIGGDGPERGDVVVFRFPDNPKLHYVKRCVAIGGDGVMLRGDTLYIRPSEGAEFIRANYDKNLLEVFGDELWVKNPYKSEHKGVQYDETARSRGALPTEMYLFGPITVPQGRYFMMGDNRDHSADSRFWGSVPYDLIVGAPWFSYFSWESRSYEDIAEKSVFQNDYETLRSVCGDDIDVKSAECKKKWDRERYKVRWDRVGLTLKGLEELI
ncbi:MAG: signal peptidase I [Helicobacteraceae bacterium]|jgi:signal peptidase I|nr:signal peptidase I [Helicobacteraceae bacterium]